MFLETSEQPSKELGPSKSKILFTSKESITPFQNASTATRNYPHTEASDEAYSNMDDIFSGPVTKTITRTDDFHCNSNDNENFSLFGNN